MSTSAPPVPQAPRLRSMVDFYLTAMRTQVQTQFQYRVATYMYLVGMVAEPVIYLVVWSTIARSHGGSVQGITAGEFAAYYIVWTLVGNMSTASLLGGLGMQLFWATVGAGLVWICWRASAKHYTAVGN